MPQPTPAISVVVDTYNQARFLAQAVRSVQAQRAAPSTEIIVVDDGSTDDTRTVLSPFGDAVRVVHQANGGQAAALNTGIGLATGDWVALLDGDDTWEPGRLAELATTDADVAFAFARQVDADGHELGLDPPPAVGRLVSSHGRAGEWLRAGKAPWFPPTSGIAVRRSLLQAIGPIPAEFRIAADGWLQLAVAIFGTTFHWSLAPLANLRIHGQNAWSGRSDFDADAASQRRALYQRLAAAVPAVAARAGRDASGLQRTYLAQAHEFEIWEHILHGRRRQALALAATWSPPASLGGLRQRAFKKLHTLAATITPVDAYAAVRDTWRQSPLTAFLRDEGAE